MTYMWILGAPDPEMSAIEALLREQGERVEYALMGGRRVDAGSAYRADGRTGTSGVAGYATGVLVECGFPGDDAGNTIPWVVVDHHRSDDPGYGRPPAEYLEASSLGQVMAILPALDPGMVPDARLIAAADHCLAAAYRGECPGVDPDALMTWRAESRAAFQGRTVEALLADVESARRVLAGAPPIHLDGFTDPVRDMRGPVVPELPEAACREGLAYLATVRDRDGREKVVLGAASAAQVEAFSSSWAPSHGLTGIYGDPARGFAGGYWVAQQRA